MNKQEFFRRGIPLAFLCDRIIIVIGEDLGSVIRLLLKLFNPFHCVPLLSLAIVLDFGAARSFGIRSPNDFSGMIRFLNPSHLPRRSRRLSWGIEKYF
nr:hypothetical protein Itr_chr15CG00090 [Ipomoea trifida]GMD85841.1 hypothetical protein Iba_chr14bCG0290 [Ipomoea batatas]